MTHTIIVRRWDYNELGPITKEAVRKICTPPEAYLIRPNRYEGGASFGGRMRKGICYLVKGACRYRFGDHEVVLRAGDIAELPEPDFLGARQTGEGNSPVKTRG